jgi:hypothetical protein
MTTLNAELRTFCEARHDHPRTLPAPATCAIGRDGVIRRAFIDTDCTTRANPPTSSPPSTPWPEATSRHRPWTGALNPPRGPHP